MSRCPICKEIETPEKYEQYDACPNCDSPWWLAVAYGNLRSKINMAIEIGRYSPDAKGIEILARYPGEADFPRTPSEILEMKDALVKNIEQHKVSEILRVLEV